MLKALTGLIRPRQVNMASGAIVRSFSISQESWEPEEISQQGYFKPMLLRSGLIGSSLIRNYGESLSYRKFFFMKSIKRPGNRGLKRTTRLQRTEESRELLE